MRRTFSRTAALFTAPAAAPPRVARVGDDIAPATPPAAVTRALHAIATLVAAIKAGGIEVTAARAALADALQPLALRDMPALCAGLDGETFAAALARASLADLARLEVAEPPPQASASIIGATLAAIASHALPALPAAIGALALGQAPAARLLAAELDLLAAAPAEAPAARARVVEALAALPRELVKALAGALPVIRAARAREPWRSELAGLMPSPALGAVPPGEATPFRQAIRIPLDQALPAGVTYGFAFRTDAALPAADWTILADGAPIFARAIAKEGIVEVTFAAALPLAAGTMLTATPPAGEYFRHYLPVTGVHWPIHPVAALAPPLRITALADPCLDGFHKPEHLAGAIGRWMAQHGRIRLPACARPLRATLRGRHRQGLIAAGGLLAAVGETPLDLVFEMLGLAHDAGEWLIHMHLPPTAAPGDAWLRLSLPDLPARGADESRDIGLIFLGLELAPLPAAGQRLGAA